MDRKQLNKKIISYEGGATFTFPISHSKVGYKSKEEAKLALCRVVFVRNHYVTIQQFKDYISNGYTFCVGNIVAEAKRFTKGNFKSTNLIVFDIDHSTISLDNILYYIKDQRPDICPTIAYETFSCDNSKDIFKYRLIYVFDEGLGKRKRMRMYNFLKELILSLFNTPDHTVIEFDPAMECETQRCYATNVDHKVYAYDIIYKPMFFNDDAKYSLEEIKRILSHNISSSEFTKYFSGLASIDDLMNVIRERMATINYFWECITNDDIYDAIDCLNAKYYASQDNIINHYANSGRLKELMDELSGDEAIHHSEFIEKHRNEYTIYTKSNVEFGDNKCILTPLNYFDVNWCKQWKGGKSQKVKDGQRRRTKLSLLSEGLRLINPDITPDELFYNILVFKFYYIDNSSDHITTYELRNLAVNACKKSLHDIMSDIEAMDNRPTYIGKGSVKGSSRKQQERSLWHKLVDEGQSYEQVLSVYPNVSLSAYKAYKSRSKDKS